MADVEIDPMPEIEAMATVAKALIDLDPGARLRVLQWAAARYEVSINGAGQHSSADDYEAVDSGGQDGDAGDVPSYEHFAELFAAASPKSDADKALVPLTGSRSTMAMTPGAPTSSIRS